MSKILTTRIKLKKDSLKNKINLIKVSIKFQKNNFQKKKNKKKKRSKMRSRRWKKKKVARTLIHR